MKILISSVYHISKYCGGNEQYLHHLAEELVKQGNEVEYIAEEYSKSKGNKFKYKKISANVFNLLGKPLPGLKWFSVLKRKRYDVVHVSGSGLPTLFLAWVAKNIYKIPTVMTYQADTNPKGLIMVGAWFENWMIPRSFDKLIATTPTYKNKLNKKFNNISVEFVPMMVAKHFYMKQGDRKIRKQGNKKMILFVGKLDQHHYYKGLDVLIEAVSKLPKDYQLIVIGEGETKTEYQQQAKELNIDKRINFAGYVENEEMPSYFENADVFVLPSDSDSEGFGLVLIEAMKCGVPTITTTAIGSAEWFFQNKVTTLVEPKNAVILAEAIRNDVEKIDLKKIDRAKKFSEKFNQEEMGRNTIEIYKSLIK